MFRADTLALDLVFVDGRSGVARPLAARFDLIFEGFFCVDLATVLLVSISRLSLAKTRCRKRCAGRG